MIGAHAVCPKTGAQLSNEQHYDDAGQPRRIPVADAHVSPADLEAELTTGAVRSSREALLTHFQRTHQYDHSANDELYQKVALWLRRLTQTASGSHDMDMIIWVALAARVRAADYDASWMLNHVEFRCPQCYGRLKYEQIDAETVHAECATNCTDTRTGRLTEIRDRAQELFQQAYRNEKIEFQAIGAL